MIVFHMDVMLARRKMSLTELSERVGITIANLSILKTGKARAVRLDTLNRLCAALDCQPADLMEFLPDPPSAGPAGGMTAPAVAVSAASCYNKGDSAGLTGLK